MSRGAELRPCREGTHQACGCPQSGNHCCLTCPLPRCVLEVRDQIQFVRTHTGPAEERGRAIVERLATGIAPTAIRRDLGLSRAQYQRALAWSRSHANDSPSPSMESTRPEPPKTRVLGAVGMG